MKKYNITKKSVFLIVLIILYTCTIVINGEGTSIKVNNEVAYRGGTVTFKATISESIEVGSGALELSYDDSVLELISGTWNVSDTDLSNFDESKKKGAFAFKTTGTVSGTLFVITFKVKDEAALGDSEVSLNITLMDGNKSIIPLTNNAGTITVTCNHTYGAWEKHNETQHKHVCSKCETEEYADHTWNSGVVTTAPTCKDPGVRTYTCTACGETKTETIPVTNDHTWGSWEKADAANHKHTCTVCGKSETAAHTWDAGKVTKAPTHTAFGEKTFTCSDCGATKTEQVEKLTEHAYGAWEKHNETQHKHTCACGDVQYAAHTWDAGKVTTAPTCKNTGIKTYTCTACGETKTETIPVTNDHTWGSWEKADAANHKHTCTVCGKSETAAHTWDKGTLTVEPSGGKEGEKTYTCTACGETKKEAVSPTHVHSYGTDWSYDGVMHWHECSCGGKKGTQSHKWDAGSIQKEAACTEAGTILYTCTVCGATKSESVEGAHTPGEWAVVTAASCTETGREERKCTTCGTILETREIAASGHEKGAWETVREATAEADGERVRKCVLCGEILERETIVYVPAEQTTKPGETTTPPVTEPAAPDETGISPIWIGVFAALGILIIAIPLAVLLKKKKS